MTREKRDPRYATTRYSSVYGIVRMLYEKGPISLLLNQFGLDEKGRVTSMWLNESE